MYGFARKGLALGMIAAAATAASLQAQDKDIVETAIDAGSFSTLAAALQAADLVGTLQGDGPFTVFAPTDDAFAKLPAGTVESLLKPENREALIGILTYHVVPGRVTAEQVASLDEAMTVNGADVRIRARNGGVRINESNVVATDVFASNGVIHVIDEVLLPPRMNGENEREMASREMQMMRRASDILTLAIDRGVPLYNHGSPAATAGIYEVGMQAVLAADFALPRRAERALERGLRDGGREHDMSDRAWTYRRAMDRALDEIDGLMARRTEH